MKRMSRFIAVAFGLSFSTVISVTAFARPYMPKTQNYSCVNQSAGSVYGKNILVEFLKDRRTVRLYDFASSMNLKLRLTPSVDASGDVTYVGVMGCSQSGTSPHCFAEMVMDLTVSPQLKNGNFRGTMQLNGQKYDCTMNMADMP